MPDENPYDPEYVKQELLKASKLEAEAQLLREQVKLYKRFTCTHPRSYRRSYYDGSSDLECDVCGIDWYQRP